MIITILSLLLSGIFCLEVMTTSVFDDDDALQPGILHSWERTPSYAPTPGYYVHGCTPSVICSSPDPEDIEHERTSHLHETQTNELGFTSGVERVGEGPSNGQPPTCIHYQIEWRVKLNNRAVAKDTEQDLAMPPSTYWGELSEKADGVLRRKIARNRRVRLDDTNLVVSVNDRSQSDLTKRFEGSDINWTVVEKQLLMWAHLYGLGKELRLQISLNYVEDGGRLLSGTDKRGTSSTTKGMLTERDTEIDAEQASGQPSVWRDVYKTMRCPGPPCRHEGQYCWQDPDGRKHYKLRSHYMKTLVKYVDQGGTIETHDDVPDSLREQLYAEENQRFERRKKSSDNPTTGSIYPPININVLPAQSRVSMPTPAGNDVTLSTPSQIDSIVIPGLLDIAVNDYIIWHQSRVSSEAFKENIQKARDVALESCLDLKQIFEDQDPEFFVKQGMKLGVARRLVNDISQWVKRHGDENDRQS